MVLVIICYVIVLILAGVMLFTDSGANNAW